jgi:hypothetical protein
VVGGCNNTIQNVKVYSGNENATEPFTLGQTIYAVASGVGTCKKIRINWGDGTTVDEYSNVDLVSHSTSYPHDYSGWGGGKTVTVEAVDGCVGFVSTKFVVAPAVYRLAYAQPGPNTCDAVPDKPFVHKGNLVLITTDPEPVMNFGCPLGGCIYDADGKNLSVAAARFPFPGLREFSLVLRVGSQVVQGGTDMRFVVTQDGPLEVCVNDDYLRDNSGGWLVRIRVDQFGAPPTL